MSVQIEAVRRTSRTSSSWVCSPRTTSPRASQARSIARSRRPATEPGCRASTAAAWVAARPGVGPLRVPGPQHLDRRWPGGCLRCGGSRQARPAGARQVPRAAVVTAATSSASSSVFRDMTTGLPRPADLPPGSSTGRLAGVPTRRTFLLGGAGIATAGLVAAGIGIEQGLLPGRPFLQAELGLNGEDGVIPDVEPGLVETGSFVSEARGGVETGWSMHPAARVSAPTARRRRAARARRRPRRAHVAGDRDRPLPRGCTSRTADAVRGRRRGRRHVVLAPATERRGRQPHGHRRAAAERRRSTRLRHVAVRTDRLVDGRVRRAETRRPPRPGAGVAVVACSPALWANPDDASASGFADAAEYERYSVFHSQADLAGIPVRVDIGTGDPFYRDVQDYVDGFPNGRPRHEHLRAGRAHAGLLAPDAAAPARVPGARLAAAGVEGDVPVVALVGVDVARGSSSHRRAVAAHADVGVGAVHPRGQAGGAREVELVAVGVAVGASRVAGLGAAGDGQSAATGVLEGDAAVDRGLPDPLERRAGRVVGVGAAAGRRPADAGRAELRASALAWLTAPAGAVAATEPATASPAAATRVRIRIPE